MGIWEYRTFNVASAQEPEQVQGIRASSSLFTVARRRAGARPRFHRGRRRAWPSRRRHQRRRVAHAFRRRSSAIGSTLRLNGEPFEVIGVMPPGFEFPRNGTGVWVPFAKEYQDDQRGSHSFWWRRGCTRRDFEQARADVEQVGRALRQRYEDNRDEGFDPDDDGRAGPRHVANDADGADGRGRARPDHRLRQRRQPPAWAARWRGGASSRCGWRSAPASAGWRASSSRNRWCSRPPAAPRPGDRLDRGARRRSGADAGLSRAAVPRRGPDHDRRTVLLFAALAALVSAALFGFAPLISLRRRESARIAARRRARLDRVANLARRLLVAVEVALAIVVLCGAGLLMKSLSGLLAGQPGSDPRDVLTLQVSLPQADTYGPPIREAFCADLSRAAEGLPGIRTIGAISHLPLSGANAGRGLTIEGYTPKGGRRWTAAYRLTCPGYFDTLGIAMLEGRDFTTAMSRRECRSRSSTARWRDAYGRRARVRSDAAEARRPEQRQPWLTVVGVAENVRHFGLDSEARREIFMPYSQAAWPVMTIVAKTVGEPLAWQSTLRDVIRARRSGSPGRPRAIDGSDVVGCR